MPVSLVQYATPYSPDQRNKADLGIYAQDQWTIKRLTLNYGVRFDSFNGHVPAQQVAATPNGWVPARSFAEVKTSPLEGREPAGRGGLRSVRQRPDGAQGVPGPICGQERDAIVAANNPVQTSVNTVTRTWTDTNGNYLPDCDLGNRAANGECGAMANQNFGGLITTTKLRPRCAQRLRRARLQLEYVDRGPA